MINFGKLFLLSCLFIMKIELSNQTSYCGTSPDSLNCSDPCNPNSPVQRRICNRPGENCYNDINGICN